MAFWTYMLHCRGGRFYVGHTDDLERRIGEHQSGLLPGFTADHLPVELVWSQTFGTRDEARAAERQLKGWSRAKKLALIRGDWERVSMLASNKGGASTSSARTGVGDGQGQVAFALTPHPAHLPVRVEEITARLLRLDAKWLTLRFKVAGAQALIVPPLAGKGRADGLWQTTCFELFIARAVADPGYTEFNLSPSERWAAYDFTGYREGMAARPVPRDPVCTARRGGGVLIFDAAIPAAALPPLPWRYGLSAVIEEEGGVKSYWAIAHPPGKPDFHHPACFAATLAAPEVP